MDTAINYMIMIRSCGCLHKLYYGGLFPGVKSRGSTAGYRDAQQQQTLHPLSRGRRNVDVMLMLFIVVPI